MTFEVASVKPAAPLDGRMMIGTRGGPGTADPERITSSNMALKDLLMLAYDVQSFQVEGPAWVDTERYDIAAKLPPGTTKEQSRMMWQALLAERFGLTLHHDSKEFQAWELVVAKGGTKLKESTLDLSAPAQPVPAGPKLDKNGFPEMNSPGMISMFSMGPNGAAAHTAGKAQTMSQLAARLGNMLHQPVVDKTGLAGKYDFTLEYTPDLNGLQMVTPHGSPPGPASGNPADSTSEPGTNLAAAVQQQLGLKLVSTKTRLDVLVVDHADKVPTEN